MPPQESVAAFNGQPQYNISEVAQGDLNNTESMRKVDKILANPESAHLSLAIPANEEHEADTRAKYRPFLPDGAVAADDWVAKLELATVTEMAQRDIAATGERLRILVLYGSLRSR
jgi:arsenic resistance protein ArsH